MDASSREAVTRFIKQWLAELPKIAATLTTALILFVASLAFKPVRSFLFAERDRGYPIFCTADPLPAPGGRRIVEFYIVNRGDERATRDKLQERLSRELSGTGASATPTITLPFDEPGRRIERAFVDNRFNDGKGELRVRTGPNGVTIDPVSIDAYAILRVIVVFSDMDAHAFNRGSKVDVPLLFEDVQQACYTRR